MQRACIIAMLLLSILGLSGMAQASASVDVRELAPIADSFFQLAIWSTEDAARIWMEGEASVAWTEFTRQVLTSQELAISLFSHYFVLGEIAPDGTPVAVVWSPWVGVLYVLEFSVTGTEIRGFGVESLAVDLAGELDATATALAIMNGIGQAEARLSELALTGAMPMPDPEGLQKLAERAKAHAEHLALLYPIEAASEAKIQSLVDSAASIRSAEFDDLLEVLAEAEEGWRASLLPVHLGGSGTRSIAVLASMMEPLDLVWLESSDQGLTSVSWIRLFDEVTTHAGGES